jgi:hypothetical protein
MNLKYRWHQKHHYRPMHHLHHLFLNFPKNLKQLKYHYPRWLLLLQTGQSFLMYQKLLMHLTILKNLMFRLFRLTQNFLMYPKRLNFRWRPQFPSFQKNQNFLKCLTHPTRRLFLKNLMYPMFHLLGLL